MPDNLLNSQWQNLDPTELMIVLHEHMGGTWQGNLSARRPSELYIPMFGPTCRIMLRFRGPKITAIERGPSFAKTQWDQISNQIENSVLTGPKRVGRDYSFSGRRVTGSWRGSVSGVQILPPPNDLPHVPGESGDHPFILEFPLMDTSVDRLTNHRRIRRHRDLTLLLNILLAGGAKSQGRPSHCWAGTEWVQQWFSPVLNPYISDALSAPAPHQLQEVAPEEYENLVGNDGMGLRVPSDLDQSICLYEALSDSNREKFDRAIFWFSRSSLLWDTSMSASLAALAFAVESMTSDSNVDEVLCPVCGSPTGSGPTKLFRNFLAAYAPGDGSETDRKDMYSLRSKVVHGDHLMELDWALPVVGPWTPPGFKERDQYGQLWKFTRAALRNWLKNRDQYLQQARQVCAYYHWRERGRPLWEADVDWEFADQEFPA